MASPKGIFRMLVKGSMAWLLFILICFEATAESKNFKANIRVLEKLTGKVKDIKLTNLKNEDTVGDFKIQLCDTFVQKITPSFTAQSAFLKIWHKKESNFELIYSNWLCNQDPKFLHADWSVYILSSG